jgi:signal transduction histidine kinase
MEIIILNNLLSNAVKYNLQGGRIDIIPYQKESGDTEVLIECDRYRNWYGKGSDIEKLV